MTSSLERINVQRLLSKVRHDLEQMVGQPAFTEPQSREALKANIMQGVDDYIQSLQNVGIITQQYSAEREDYVSHEVAHQRNLHVLTITMSKSAPKVLVYKGSWRRVKKKIMRFMWDFQQKLHMTMTICPRIPVEFVQVEFTVNKAVLGIEDPAD